MVSTILTCRQQILLALFFFLALSFLGLFSLFHKSVEMSAAGVSNLHRLQGKPQRLKHTDLVLGDAAGQGLPGRVQCRGFRAVAATHKMEGAHNSSCVLSKAERISFVTFFMPSIDEIPENDANDGTIKLRNATIHKVNRPYAILSVFFESIKLSNPRSSLTILTGQSAHMLTAKLPGDVHIARIGQNYTRSNLMLQRLESYAYFLGELLEGRLRAGKHTHSIEHVVFMDGDIIVVDNLGCLFETHVDFDIALTFRNNKDQPINSGVIAIRGENESLSRARAFLLDVVEVYRERFVKAASMLDLSTTGSFLAFSNLQLDAIRRCWAIPWHATKCQSSAL